MEELKVVLWVVAAMVSARFVTSCTKHGKIRFLFLLPVIYLLPFLPLHFSSIHLHGISTFCLAWLTLFKLFLLFAGFSPLSADLPLFAFLASATLPIKLVDQQSSQKSKNSTTTSLFLPSATKVSLISVLISCYRFKDTIHPYLPLVIYSIHLYIALELVLAATTVVTSLLPRGIQLETQFNAPYLSTSITTSRIDVGISWSSPSSIRRSIYPSIADILLRLWTNTRVHILVHDPRIANRGHGVL